MGPSGISVGGSSACSYSASRYSYSKTLESIQVDHLFREAKTPVFSPSVNEIPILPLEYEYRFTEYDYEYEKSQWYELPATIMPGGPWGLDSGLSFQWFPTPGRFIYRKGSWSPIFQVGLLRFYSVDIKPFGPA